MHTFNYEQINGRNVDLSRECRILTGVSDTTHRILENSPKLIFFLYLWLHHSEFNITAEKKKKKKNLG